SAASDVYKRQVDYEDDGIWEGVVGGSPLRTPTYRFLSPPPSGGYRVRIRQELCGNRREDVLTWNPTLSGALVPEGAIQVRNQVFCAGDSVTLGIAALAHFSPGQAGHRVAWDFGGGWTSPSEMAAETTFVWGGGALSVRAQLYHPSGGTRIIGPVTISAPPLFRSIGGHTRLTPVGESCTQGWCLPPLLQSAHCGGTYLRFSLLQRPRAASWQWRLLLPTDTVTFPGGSVPAEYQYAVPQSPGVYAFESQLITSCGTWREAWVLRVESQGLGRPGAIHSGLTTCRPGFEVGSISLYGPEVTFSVCAGAQVWIPLMDIIDYSGGGIEGVQLVYANGQRPEIVAFGGGSLSFVAPFQPGRYTLYQVWRSCTGSRDTVSLHLEVKEATAASFQAPTRACVGQPVSFQRRGPLSWTGHPVALQWNMGDGTFRGDTARTFRYAYGAPGVYTVTLQANVPSCGPTTFSRTVAVADRPPTAQILSASLTNGVLTFAGQATGADSVVWDFGDGNVALGILSGTHTYAGTGPYTVRLYAFNGCGVDTAEVRVTALRGEVGEVGWRLYPNPARGEVWVESPAGGGEVRLYTVAGQLVASWQVGEGLHRLPLERVPAGLYVVRLIGAQGVGQVKLLIE
ncbi:MAG: PKD domain-containing protein, partial [Bacteroidia bacterium]|nr:PKD domain-containing protein [Bacteroidia bacterium]